MSSFNRRSVVLMLGAAPLSACGFQPVFVPNAPAHMLFGSVLVNVPTSRANFDLTRAIEARLGRPETVLYELSVSQSVSTSSLAVQGSSAVTRFNLNGRASFSLTEEATKTVIASGSVKALTSYSTASNSTSTSAARIAATRRVSEALADQIVNRLLATIATGP